MIGVALVLFGRKLIKPAVFFAGLITCTLFACLLFYSVYFTKTSQVEDFWFFLGGGILTGIIVGILLSCFVKLGAAILAGWGGFCIGLILNESIVYRAEQEWLFWVTIVACTVTAAVLVFFMFDIMVITACVTLGAYCMVRGIAAYAGHYYNEMYMAKMLKEGLIDDIDPLYWCYVAGFVVAVLVGFLIQYNVYKKEVEKEKRKKQHPYMANNKLGETPQEDEKESNRVH